MFFSVFFPLPWAAPVYIGHHGREVWRVKLWKILKEVKAFVFDVWGRSKKQWRDSKGKDDFGREKGLSISVWNRFQRSKVVSQGKRWDTTSVKKRKQSRTQPEEGLLCLGPYVFPVMLVRWRTGIALPSNILLNRNLVFHRLWKDNWGKKRGKRELFWSVKIVFWFIFFNKRCFKTSGFILKVSMSQLNSERKSERGIQENKPQWNQSTCVKAFPF